MSGGRILGHLGTYSAELCRILQPALLKVLEDNGIPIDLVAGCSQGSIIAVGYAAGVTTADMVEIALRLGKRKNSFLAVDLTLTRPGILADYFPAPFPNEQAARANNSGALPPDLSMIIKAREGGEAYVYSILTGFHQTPPKGFTVTPNKYYNPYFEGWNISMPPPLAANGVTFSDGTKATVEQEAHDVVTFLTWASEPKMEERKRFGFGVMVFLVLLAGVLYGAYRKVWKDAH